MHAIDTNVLIYAFDAHDKEKHKKASRILNEVFTGNAQAVVTNQILAEFVSAATTKLNPPLTTEEITRFLRSVQSSENWEIVNYDVSCVILAAEMQKHFWDSLIAATLRGREVALLTENQKHFSHTKLKTKNPF